MKKKHRGALNIDVSALHLKVSGKICVGLKREDKKMKKQPIALKIEINKQAVSFSRMKNSGLWSNGGGNWIKMKLK